MSRRRWQKAKSQSIVSRQYWSLDSPINKPIPQNPTLDPLNTAIISYITSQMASDKRGVLDCSIYGSRVYHATAATPRVMVAPSASRDPLNYPMVTTGLSIPLDPTWLPAPGTDAHLCVVDTDGLEYSFWEYTGGANPTAGGAGVTDTNSSEITSRFQGATAARFSRLAGLIRIEEWERGFIDHAIFIASSITKPGSPPPFRFPAKQSDGKNLDGAPLNACLEEGARLQLDPNFDVDAQAGWQPWHRIVAKAMQTYGMYVGDTGGALLSIPAEIPKSATGPEATARHNSPLLYSLGIADRYARFPDDFPWSSMRVLARWDDTVPDPLLPKISTLQDDFTSGVLDRAFRWGYSYSSSVIVSGNRVVLDQTENYSSALTSDYFDCRDDAVFSKIIPATGGNGSYTTALRLGKDSANFVAIMQSGTSLLFDVVTDGVRLRKTLGTYSPTAHAWWRIRQTSGSFFADTSSNGINWTQLGTTVHAWSAASLQLSIVAGFWQTGQSAAQSYVEAINVT